MHLWNAYTRLANFGEVVEINFCYFNKKDELVLLTTEGVQILPPGSSAEHLESVRLNCSNALMLTESLMKLLNFKEWDDARARVKEARAKAVLELRKQRNEMDLRQEHTRISGLMQIKAQSLVPQLVKVYARDLQTGTKTLNDLAQMALDSVEYLKSKVDNKEVFEQMIANEWGKGHPPIWLKAGETVRVPVGTLEGQHKKS